MVRFVHSADWQLGTSRRWLGPGPAARLAEARIQAITRLGRLCAEHEADFLLVCGDVFDLEDVPADVLQQALDALAEVPVPVHLVPGNHDPAGAAGLWARPSWRDHLPGHVHVHTATAAVAVAPGLELVPVPWPAKRPERDLVADALADLTPVDPGAVRVLGAHGAIDPVLSAGHRTDIDLGTVRAALEAGLVHYVALGDHHAPALVGGDARIRYPGTPEPTDWRDASPGRVLLVDLPADDPAALVVTEHVVGEWEFTVLEHRVASDLDIVRLEERLERLPHKRTHAVRLTLSGALTPPGRAGLEQVLERAAARLAALEVRGEALRSIPALDDLTGADGLGLDYVGFVRDAVTELGERHRGAVEPAPQHDPDPAVEPAGPRTTLVIPALDDDAPARDAEAAGDALVLLHAWARADAGVPR